MASTLQQLVSAADALLEPSAFSDYCPNGLQVEGRPEIKKLASGVTACQALVDAALAWGADAIVVHHGYFWKGEAAEVVGPKRRRLGALLSADVSLLAYHLPLDAHPRLGNNAQLARLLGIEVEGGLDSSPRPIGNVGRLSKPVSATDFARQVALKLGREPLLIESAGSSMIERVGWCTGAAQGYIEQAAEAGVDLFLSGEISEQTVHLARELGVHYLAAGHHATERYGVRALGEALAAECGVEHRFIDIDNPV